MQYPGLPLHDPTPDGHGQPSDDVLMIQSFMTASRHDSHAGSKGDPLTTTTKNMSMFLILHKHRSLRCLNGLDRDDD